MPLPAAEGEVERRRIGVRGHRQHDHQHHDDGDDRQDDDAELFVAHFHCLHSLCLYLRPAEGTAAAPGRLAPAPLRIRCPKYNPKRRKLQGVQHKLEICNVNFKKTAPEGAAKRFSLRGAQRKNAARRQRQFFRAAVRRGSNGSFRVRAVRRGSNGGSCARAAAGRKEKRRRAQLSPSRGSGKMMLRLKTLFCALTDIRPPYFSTM